MLSVVIPTLDEAENLGRLRPALQGEREPDEIAAAAGGSRDRTVAAARARSPPGRGQQLRAGARGKRATERSTARARR